MSTITIYGGTGYVGSAITQEAVNRGHEVTVVTRTGAKQTDTEQLRYEIGDFAGTDNVVKRAENSDALIIALSGGPDEQSRQALINNHQKLINSTPKTRLLIAGGAGALRTQDGTLVKDSPDFPAQYKGEATTQAAVLRLYQATGEEIDWTMIHPSPNLIPGERAAHYILGGDVVLGDSVTTGTLAAALIDEFEKPNHKRANFTVTDA